MRKWLATTNFKDVKKARDDLRDDGWDLRGQALCKPELLPKERGEPKPARFIIMFPAPHRLVSGMLLGAWYQKQALQKESDRLQSAIGLGVQGVFFQRIFPMLEQNGWTGVYSTSIDHANFDGHVSREDNEAMRQIHLRLYPEELHRSINNYYDSFREYEVDFPNGERYRLTDIMPSGAI